MIMTRFLLKPSYESGELIVLNNNDIGSEIPSNSQLKIKGPLDKSSKDLVLFPKQTNDGQNYFEFYIINPGSYLIETQWGRATTVISERQSLSFQKEFGIFSFVVIVLVSLMAWRYLRRSRSLGSLE